MRTTLASLLLACCILPACGGSGQGTDSPTVEARLLPVAVESQSAGTEIFQAALPVDDGQPDSRVPAVSSLSLAGASFNEASGNVTAGSTAADYNPLAGTSEYAIWRFLGTPQDSIGTVSVTIDSAEAGARYWVAVADYSSGRWDWRGGKEDGSGFETDLAGSPGQHSSAAGYIYVAVLSDTDKALSVGSVSIEYLQRYNVSGVVLDMQDRPLEGVLVTTNLADPQQVFSAADGSFSLAGIPNGNWAVMATLAGHEFFPAATNVTVADADTSGLVLRGNPRVSGLVGSDEFEPNDFFANASDMGSGPLTGASLGILDDPVDYYSFEVPQEGWYYLEFIGDDSILFPDIKLQNDESANRVASDFTVLSGATWVGYYFQRPGTYYASVGCEAGAGQYSLSIKPGQTHSFGCYIEDTGDPGDGDDGIFESLRSSRIELRLPDATCTLYSSGNGYVSMRHVAPQEATIVPVDPLYTFSPAQEEHDFSTADLVDLDFNVSAVAPDDPMEPNNDNSNATQLVLPLSAPITGWIGGESLTNDEYDVFRFESSGNKHLFVQVRFPQNGPLRFIDSGGLELRDSLGNNYTLLADSIFQIDGRSQVALPAQEYFLTLNMDGNLMPYEIWIEEYDPLSLSAYYEYKGVPLEDVKFSYITADASIMNLEYCFAGLAEVEDKFRPGERVLVHHQRHGMQFDPEYEWVEFGTQDIQLTPTATPSTDKLEPSDVFADVPEVQFPVQVEASCSSSTDNYDYYMFSLQGPESLVVQLGCSSPDALVRLRFSKAPSSQVIYEHIGRGDHSFYYRTPDPGDYIVEVSVANAVDLDYSLQINKAGFNVYSISGSLDNGEPSENYLRGYILNHTTGEYREATGSSYLLGYYPNGSYEIQWQISNRNITPSGKTTIAISNADAVLDYSAVYSDKDSNEPNDNSGSAALLTLPVDLTANLDYDNDYLPGGRDTADYYKFIAPTDGHIELQSMHQENSPAEYDISLFEGNISTLVNIGKFSPDGSSQTMRWNVKAGETYFVKVDGFVDLRYQLLVDYL